MKLAAGKITFVALTFIGVSCALPDEFVRKLEPKSSATKRYVVVMEAEPLVTTFGRDGLSSPAAEAKKNGLKKGHEKALKMVGKTATDAVYNYTVSLNGFAADLTDIEAAKMAGAEGVAMVLPDVMRNRTTDASPDFLGFHDPASPWATGVDGEGVVVGVIDTGIWPEHPSFGDDGSYPPPPVTLEDPACEFGNTAANSNDAPFTCNNKLIGARQMLATYRFFIGARPDEFDSARDDDGHGTHTASTAAGNAGVEASIYGIPRGTISGIAPRAHVIAYKGLGNLGGFTSDLAAAIDQAVADGVDVINYSVGGGASGLGADEFAFLFAADAGVLVATSAGNSGPNPATLGNPGTMPWLTTVGASTQRRFFQGTVVLGDGSEYPGASITNGIDAAPLVDAADAGSDLCIPDNLDPAIVTGKIVLCRRGFIARSLKSFAVLQAGGVGMIMYENTDDNSLFTDTHWVPSVHIDNTPGLQIKAYVDSATSPTAQIISELSDEWPSAPSMTYFSSRGPNPVAPDIIKPDITAPGIQILAGNSPFPDSGSYPGELFQAIAGTSMSSPHVAGLFALLKQAHPEWSAAAAKSALMTTAYQGAVKNDRVSPADPFDFGAGHANPGKAVQKGSAFQPGLVYDIGFLEYLGFLCDAFPEAVAVANPAATCALLEGNGIPIEAENLNYPSIGIAEVPGRKTVIRKVTSVAQEAGWRSYTASLRAPTGFDLTVNPMSIRLKEGMSATFEVTISAESAPIGEWQFGSLTWTDETGNYDVYSPIAVKASLFKAPAVITGTGELGSFAFDVQFGYTGTYSTNAYGLVPATISSDSVVQDPNKNFDPSDGFSNLHEFMLVDSSYFRIRLPPEAVSDGATIDLDVFVYGPDGSLAATSTSGGTREEIDIENPASGIWKVYVHGWQTAGPAAAYDLYAWNVERGATHTLIVEEAPANAEIATAGTVSLSWAGATVGEWHFGVVQHTIDGNDSDMTLVEVDNRS